VILTSVGSIMPLETSTVRLLVIILLMVATFLVFYSCSAKVIKAVWRCWRRLSGSVC